MSDSVATRPSAGKPEARTSTPERYVLRERLGEGAMGVVWMARDTALDRDVALKLLHDRFLGDDNQAQLAREARVMARLSHPNVVAVYDVGEQGGRTFLAMELVTGKPLSQWLESERPWQDIVGVFRGVAEGLAAAHAAGILHRDIKPTNILIGDDGRPRIADFGVAHARSTGALDPATPLTTTTAGMIGTPAYMALERICGEPADPRGDQFSFCVALYEALHGKRPFEATTIGGLISAIVRGPPPPVRDVPAWLHAAIARGLAANPAERHASMTELGAALLAPRTRKLRRAVIASAALAVAAVAAVILWPTSEPARALAVAPDAGITAPDAGALAAVPDAAIVADDAAVAVELDAAITPPDATTAVVRRTPPPPVEPPVDDATARARMRELMTKWKAALDAGKLVEARQFSEQAITYARGNPDPRVVSATTSCRLADEKRAREHLRKLPRGQPMSRIAVVRVCRRSGIELDDLLTPEEARHAQ